jgi:reactive intermediate/imine deaminase
MRILCLLIVSCSFTLVQAQQKEKLEYLARTRAGAAPFSEAVRVGDVLYLSGQLGVDGSGSLVTGGVKAETKQTLENIRSILERNNSGMDRVVKCTVMLADIADRSAMSEVYVTFFPKDRMPARSTFGTSGLALGAKVEIECMAAVK